MASQKFWVKRGEKALGPFSPSQIRQLALDGKLQPSHLLSQDGQRWSKAEKVKGLEFTRNEQPVTRRQLARSSKLLCDICGSLLASSDMKRVPGSDILLAANNGYVPSGMPLREEVASVGKTLDEMWTRSVNANIANEWGLCGACFQDFQNHGRIEFTCPKCSRRISAPSNTAGRQGKCPHCTSINTIPTKTQLPEEPPASDFTSFLDENLPDTTAGKPCPRCSKPIPEGDYVCGNCGQDTVGLVVPADRRMTLQTECGKETHRFICNNGRCRLHMKSHEGIELIDLTRATVYAYESRRGPLSRHGRFFLIDFVGPTGDHLWRLYFDGWDGLGAYVQFVASTLVTVQWAPPPDNIELGDFFAL